MVEGTGPENRNPGNRIGGSNPPASALILFNTNLKYVAGKTRVPAMGPEVRILHPPP